MPNISNATVASGTGLSTAGNGGRKLVRLANGWLVAAVLNKSTTPHAIKIYVSKNNGLTFEDVCFIQHVTNNFTDLSIVASGTRVMVLSSFNGTIAMYHGLEVLTQTNTNIYTPYLAVDTQTTIGNVSLAINDAGTELHAAWSSKNATYPNSFNIRYAKGTINGDGSVTWGAVEQVTSYNNSSVPNFAINPNIILDSNNAPCITFEQQGYMFGTTSGMTSASGITIIKRDKTLNSDTSVANPTWSHKGVYSGNTHAQSNPSFLFVPSVINGLANGRLWVAWHGKDATDSAKFNVRVSYSDDGGVTWATPVKLTSGNTYDRLNPSLSADKSGKVFVLYEDHQWSPDIGIRMKTFSGGSWGTETSVATADTAEQHPSALVDFTLQMTTPPFIYTDTTLGIRFTGNFNVGASVSPVSGALGNKETTALTAYTITPEAGSTVTQIVERINGVIVNTFNNPASLSRTFMIPQVNWDGISFWQSHTAEIIVADSNGAVTTTTYTFVKALADDSPLLEVTAATEDAYERISQKRDALAAQVGLSAGSTFDAISEQLASGSTLKIATGDGGTSNTVSFNGLGFRPRIILVFGSAGGSNRFTAVYDENDTTLAGYYLKGAYFGSGPVYALKSEVTITNNGFTMPVHYSGFPKTWIALG